MFLSTNLSTNGHRHWIGSRKTATDVNRARWCPDMRQEASPHHTVCLLHFLFIRTHSDHRHAGPCSACAVACCARTEHTGDGADDCGLTRGDQAPLRELNPERSVNHHLTGGPEGRARALHFVSESGDRQLAAPAFPAEKAEKARLSRTSHPNMSDFEGTVDVFQSDAASTVGASSNLHLLSGTCSWPTSDALCLWGNALGD